MYIYSYYVFPHPAPKLLTSSLSFKVYLKKLNYDCCWPYYIYSAVSSNAHQQMQVLSLSVLVAGLVHLCQPMLTAPL